MHGHTYTYKIDITSKKHTKIQRKVLHFSQEKLNGRDDDVSTEGQDLAYKRLSQLYTFLTEMKWERNINEKSEPFCLSY